MSFSNEDSTMKDITYGAALGGIANTPSVPFAAMGQVSFSRRDGAASVQITSSLSAEAATELDAFLRVLIAKDAPRVAALQTALMEQAQRSQYEAMRRAQSQSQGSLNTRGYDQ